MRPPELREPGLPASARRVATGLRKGWTTGTCAAAAAKAACLLLRDGVAPGEVEVPLPRGSQRPRFVPERCERVDDAAVAVVVKDAGDDPDVTHGAHLTATVRLV
ncbi:MAG: cobalt-precorrin-5B (C(1))-methyltransferase, partial [Actinomycetota bacterium]